MMHVPSVSVMVLMIMVVNVVVEFSGGGGGVLGSAELFQIGERDYGKVLPFLERDLSAFPGGPVVKHHLQSVIHRVGECPTVERTQPAWFSDVKQANDQLSGWIQKHHLNINEGGIFGQIMQLCFYSMLMKRITQHAHKIQVCETGFNAGHSATMWLAASPLVSYLGFDLGVHDYTRVIAGEMELEHGRRRFRLIYGSSVDTLPKFIAENPGFSCDVLNVDGGHSMVVALHDIINFYRMLPTTNSSSAGTSWTRPHFAMIDDTNCIEGVCGPVMRALRLSEEVGLLHELYRQCERHPTRPPLPFSPSLDMMDMQCSFGFSLYIYNRGPGAEQGITKLQEFIRNNPRA